MNKAIIVVIALMLVAGMAYAASDDPVTTVVKSTGNTLVTAADGTVATLDVAENNPVTTAIETTGKVAEDSIKTVTFQKVDKTSFGKSASKTAAKPGSAK